MLLIKQNDSTETESISKKSRSIIYAYVRTEFSMAIIEFKLKFVTRKN